MKVKDFFKTKSNPLTRLFNKKKVGARPSISKPNVTVSKATESIKLITEQLSGIQNSFDAQLIQQQKQINILEQILQETKKKPETGGEDKNNLPDIPNIDVTKTEKPKPTTPPKTSGPVTKPSGPIAKPVEKPSMLSKALKYGKGVAKGGIVGLLGGLALDYAEEKTGEAGYTRTSAGLGIASSAATGAGIGSAVGSLFGGVGAVPGGIIGGAIGAGVGAYQSGKKLLFGETPTFSGDDKQVMDMIKAHEGVRTKPYQDSRGLWTVGVGHLIGDGKTLPPEWNREFSMEEIDNLFAKDYAEHKEAAQKIPGFDKANATGQAALIDLTYNMGPSWYKKFPKASEALQNGDFDTFANEMQNSAWFQQVGNRGPQIVAMIKSGGGGDQKQGATQVASADSQEKIPDTNTQSDIKASGGDNTTGASLETQPGISLSGVDPSVVSGVESLQQQLGKKLVISSGSRTSSTPGVSGTDPHQMNKAVDISYKSSNLNESDIKQLTQLAISAGFTGIGVEGNHLHLDTSHATKTLWGSDYHFGSAPDWAKGMTDWGKPATQVAQAQTKGSSIASASTSIEANEMSASKQNQVIALQSNQKSQETASISSSPTVGEVALNSRIKQIFPQLTSLAA